MSVQYGRGDELAVTTTAAEELIEPDATNGGGAQNFANELHIWNTGSADIRVMINSGTANFTVATAALIPAGKDHYWFNFGNPIKSFTYATESSTSTIKYAANR